MLVGELIEAEAEDFEGFGDVVGSDAAESGANPSTDSGHAELSRNSEDAEGGEASSQKIRRGPCGKKRIRILEAAVQLFTTRDYHQVLMEHVSEKAGVGKGTVYCYFKTKEDLFLELVHLAVDRASEVIREGLAGRDPVIQRLRKSVAMTLEYFRKNEAFYAILYHDKVFRFCQEREDLDLKRAELRGLFIQLIAEGIAEGSIRSDMEPAFAAVILMTSMRASLRNFGAERTSEQLSEQILKIFLEGVEPRGKSAGDPIGLAERADRSGSPAEHLPTLDSDTIARLDPLATLSDESEVSDSGKRTGRAKGKPQRSRRRKS